MTEDSKGTSARGFAGLVPGARRIRYGGAMLDEQEIAAVNNVMRTGMIIGEQVQTFEKPCALCGAGNVYLDEIVLDDRGGRMFVCSDTDFCETRRSDGHRGEMLGEAPAELTGERP